MLPLPAGTWRDLLTGATLTGPRPLLATLTERHPVALLIPAGSPSPDLDAAAPALRCAGGAEVTVFRVWAPAAGAVE